MQTPGAARYSRTFWVRSSFKDAASDSLQKHQAHAVTQRARLSTARRPPAATPGVSLRFSSPAASVPGAAPRRALGRTRPGGDTEVTQPPGARPGPGPAAAPPPCAHLPQPPRRLAPLAEAVRPPSPPRPRLLPRARSGSRPRAPYLGRRPRARRRRRRGRSAARGGDPGGGAGSGAEQPQARSLLPHPLLGAPPQPPGAVLGPGDAPAFVKGERGARGSAEQRAAPAPAELLGKKGGRVWPEQRRQGTRAASRPPRVFPCPAQQGQAAARGARL